MKKNYPSKKVNFTLAAFAVCFLMLFLAPSNSSMAGGPMMVDQVYIIGGPSTSNGYFVLNGKGTYAILAYFPEGTFTSEDAHRQKVNAFLEYYNGSALIGVEYSAILKVFKNGSGLLIGTITAS